MKIDVPLFIAGDDGAEAARRLADTGIDGAFCFEGPNDVFVPLARAAGVGDLDLYSNVAISFPRSPTHLAYTAWDLQRLTGGRFLLGLGSQVRAHVERRFGAAFARPVERMADQVQAIHAVFADWQHGERLDHRGAHWQLDLMPPLFRPPALVEGPPPVLVAAVGPRMTAMAVAVADGVILHPFTTLPFLHDSALPAIAAGLLAATRPREDLIVIAGAIAAVGADDAERAMAREAVRGLIAFYGSTPAYRGVLDSIGRGDLQPALRELTREQRWGDLAALVDDEVVDNIAVCGDPASVAGQLIDRYHGHADRVAINFPYAISLDTVRALVDELRPRIAAPGS